MQYLSVQRFGLALGLAFAILYVICILIIVIFGPQSLAYIVSIIFHGLDMSALVSREVGFWMGIAGTVIIFILGWILGMLIAGIYNATLPKKK